VGRPFFSFFFLFFLSPSLLHQDPLAFPFFIVWNVGQGQWATSVEAQTCHHFDMGGEKNPLSRLRSLCGTKNNVLYLSHWDWDHIGFSFPARRVLQKACLRVSPLGPSSPRKMKLRTLYPPCLDTPDPERFSWHELTRFTAQDLKKKSNDLSHVLVARKKYLLPGDSSSFQEKIWGPQAKDLGTVRVLLLGHHGSKTSTSEELLRRLPGLKLAVASARRSRYGHPHPEVVARLRKFKIPLLRTEDWGNLWFQEGRSP